MLVGEVRRQVEVFEREQNLFEQKTKQLRLLTSGYLSGSYSLAQVLNPSCEEELLQFLFHHFYSGGISEFEPFFKRLKLPKGQKELICTFSDNQQPVAAKLARFLFCKLFASEEHIFTTCQNDQHQCQQTWTLIFQQQQQDSSTCSQITQFALVVEHLLRNCHKGICLLHFLAHNSSYITFLLENLHSMSIHSLVLRLIYSDHSEKGIQYLFQSGLIEKMLQQLCEVNLATDVLTQQKMDALDHMALLLAEILYAPYVTTRGDAVFTRDVPIDPSTNEAEFQSLSGATKQIANSPIRKFTSRKIHHLVTLLVKNPDRMTQLVQNLIHESTMPTFTSNSYVSLFRYLLNVVETVEFTTKVGLRGSVSMEKCSSRFKCRTHLVRSGRLQLKQRIGVLDIANKSPKQLSSVILQLNSLLGLRIITLSDQLKAGTERNRNISSEHFIPLEDIIKVYSVTEPCIESSNQIDTVPTVKHWFVVERMVKTSKNRARHHSVQTEFFFQTKDQKEQHKWVQAVQNAISGNCKNVEIFCSEDLWKHTVIDFKRLRVLIISNLMEQHEDLTKVLKLSHNVGTKKSSYYLLSYISFLLAAAQLESRRLNNVFLSGVIKQLMPLYELYPNSTMLHAGLTQFFLFFLLDASHSRSRNCPIIAELLLSKGKQQLISMIIELLRFDQKHAYFAQIQLILKVLLECHSHPISKSQSRIKSILNDNSEWQEVMEKIVQIRLEQQGQEDGPEQQCAKNLLFRLQNLSITSDSNNSVRPPTQPDFQRDIIQALASYKNNSNNLNGSQNTSFLEANGCIFGFVHKKSVNNLWKLTLIVFEQSSLKLWYCYPNECTPKTSSTTKNSKSSIRWRWVLSEVVEKRFYDGVDAVTNRLVGHYGLLLTTPAIGPSNKLSKASPQLLNEDLLNGRGLELAFTSFELRDKWRNVLEDASEATNQLKVEYNQLALDWDKNKGTSITSCEICHTHFTLIRWRHVCRRCGKWLCGKCCEKKKPIVECGLFKPVRHCDQCYEASGGSLGEELPLQVALITNDIPVHRKMPKSDEGVASHNTSSLPQAINKQELPKNEKAEEDLSQGSFSFSPSPVEESYQFSFSKRDYSYSAELDGDDDDDDDELDKESFFF